MTWLTDQGVPAGTHAPRAVPRNGRPALGVTVLVLAAERVDVPRLLVLLAVRLRVLPRPRVPRLVDALAGTRRLGALRHRITPITQMATARNGVVAGSGPPVLARPPAAVVLLAVPGPAAVPGHPAVPGLVAAGRPAAARRGPIVPVTGWTGLPAGARAGATRRAASVLTAIAAARVAPVGRRAVLTVLAVLAGPVLLVGPVVLVGPVLLAGRAVTVGRRTRIVVTARRVRRFRPGVQARPMARRGSVVTTVAAPRMHGGTRDRHPGPRPAVFRESAPAPATVQRRSDPNGGQAAKAAPMELPPGGHGPVMTPVPRAVPALGPRARVKAAGAATVPVIPAGPTTPAGLVRAIPTAGTVRATRTEATGRAAIALAMANVATGRVQLVPGIRRARAARQRLAVPRHPVARQDPVVARQDPVARPRGAARRRRRGTAGTRGASPATAAPGWTGRRSPVQPSPIRSPPTSWTRSPAPS
jgi:hypothetical protein